mgnify:CR=1 FL=1|jgi:hypothetical protein
MYISQIFGIAEKDQISTVARLRILQHKTYSVLIKKKLNEKIHFNNLIGGQIKWLTNNS